MPKSMNHTSALTHALSIGKHSRSARFDWEGPEQVSHKIEEEWAELKQALKEGHPHHIQEELGDLLFTLAQLARHLELDPEQTLQAANQKFSQRFRRTQQLMIEEGQDPLSLSLEERESYWQRVKQLEK